MTILVIDGQGGKIGSAVTQAIIKNLPEVQVIAVGTNSIATATMIKSGASLAATGENAVRVALKKADIVIGPIGIVIADSLLGEVTPGMALAVAQSSAKRILIPVNRCDNMVAGVRELSLGSIIDDVISKVKALDIT